MNVQWHISENEDLQQRINVTRHDIRRLQDQLQYLLAEQKARFMSQNAENLMDQADE